MIKLDENSNAQSWELVINKSWGESGDSTIKILPNVSNEIKLI